MSLTLLFFVLVPSPLAGPGHRGVLRVFDSMRGTGDGFCGASKGAGELKAAPAKPFPPGKDISKERHGCVRGAEELRAPVRAAEQLPGC